MCSTVQYLRWWDVEECLRGGNPEDALRIVPRGLIQAGASTLHLLAFRGGHFTKEPWYHNIAAELCRQARCCEMHSSMNCLRPLLC